MHVLIAPDSFGTVLTAAEAGAAIAEGWSLAAPHDSVEIAPMSDGGVGFVDALHSALGGELVLTSVDGPAGEPVPATILATGSIAYVEAAQACGLSLLADTSDPAHVWRASSYGVGQLIGQVVDFGASRIVVGLGSIGTNDAGAGLLRALGALPAALRYGPGALATLEFVDAEPARQRLAGVEIVAASDVETPLLGLRGTTNLYGAARGVAADDLSAVDAALARFAGLLNAGLANTPGAGAGGGLGYALAALGAERRPVLELVVELVELAAKSRRADLVITATHRFDGSSLRGAVVAAVAHTTGPTGRPCIVLADVVEVGRREMNAYGIESAYAVDERTAGATLGGGAALSALAGRVARSWSPAR